MARFNRFRQEVNEERPHEALGQETPGSVYEPSARQFPRKLPQWVGLEEVGDGLWDVHFSRLRLGRLDEERMQIEDAYGPWSRWDALPMSPDRSVTRVPD